LAINPPPPLDAEGGKAHSVHTRAACMYAWGSSEKDTRYSSWRFAVQVQAATYEWTRCGIPPRLRFRSAMIFFLLYRARPAKRRVPTVWRRSIRALPRRTGRQPYTISPIANSCFLHLASALNRPLPVLLACFSRASRSGASCFCFLFLNAGRRWWWWWWDMPGWPWSRTRTSHPHTLRSISYWWLVAGDWGPRAPGVWGYNAARAR
jgi:hypothetical protein